MISINGFKTDNSGSMVQEKKWLFSLKLMDHTKPWWFQLPKKNKKPHNLIFRNTRLKCWKKDMLCSTSMTRSNSSKDLKWKEEDNLESQKCFRSKFFHSILKEKLLKSAMRIVQKQPKNILRSFRNKVRLWIHMKSSIIFNNQECSVDNLVTMESQRGWLSVPLVDWLNSWALRLWRERVVFAVISSYLDILKIGQSPKGPFLLRSLTHRYMFNVISCSDGLVTTTCLKGMLTSEEF